MKKVINGKMYNTETANYIASNRSDYYKNDFRYFEEDLYQKKTKEFFLYGYGGAASKYAESLSSGGFIDGEKIIPLSENEAREWVEKNLEADKYTEIFGKTKERENMNKKYTYYGYEVSACGVKSGRVDKDTLRRVVGGVLNNSLVEKTEKAGLGSWEVVNGSQVIYYDTDGNEYTEEEAYDKILELEEKIENAEDRLSDLEEEMDKDVPDCYLEQAECEEKELEQEIKGWEDEIETLQEEAMRDIYKYYIVSREGAEIILEESSELVMYNDELDVYVWCICSCGIDMKDILTDIPIPGYVK